MLIKFNTVVWQWSPFKSLLLKFHIVLAEVDEALALLFEIISLVINQLANSHRFFYICCDYFKTISTTRGVIQLKSKIVWPKQIKVTPIKAQIYYFIWASVQGSCKENSNC